MTDSDVSTILFTLTTITAIVVGVKCYQYFTDPSHPENLSKQTQLSFDTIETALVNIRWCFCRCNKVSPFNVEQPPFFIDNRLHTFECTTCSTCGKLIRLETRMNHADLSLIQKANNLMSYTFVPVIPTAPKREQEPEPGESDLDLSFENGTNGANG